MWLETNNKYSVVYKKVVYWQCMDIYLNSNCHLRNCQSPCEYHFWHHHFLKVLDNVDV